MLELEPTGIDKKLQGSPHLSFISIRYWHKEKKSKEAVRNESVYEVHVRAVRGASARRQVNLARAPHQGNVLAVGTVKKIMKMTDVKTVVGDQCQLD